MGEASGVDTDKKDEDLNFDEQVNNFQKVSFLYRFIKKFDKFHISTVIWIFFNIYYLAHVIEQPIFRIPNLDYLQRNFCFDFFLMIVRTHFEASLRFRKN